MGWLVDSLFPHSSLNSSFLFPGVVRAARIARLGTTLLLAAGEMGHVLGQAVPPSPLDPVVLPPSVPDPIEPLNRIVWQFNKGLLIGVIKPTAWVYRRVVIKPVRGAIARFSRNLTYPGRLINLSLQGRWTGARDETYRFAYNSTAGVLGIWDVATRWGVPKSDADFGQTFGTWGWNPQCFLMLPLFGPSNERDALGLASDTAANPLLYVAPYRPVAGRPLSYLGPYSYFSYAATYNGLADTVDESVRFSRAEMDPYSQIQYAWTFVRSNHAVDLSVKGPRDEASLETIESIYFSHQDPEFPGRGHTRSVRIPSTGKRLKYTCWLQPGNAPVVYIAPGLGSHRLSHSSLAMAEMVYRNGFSAVCVSSVFHAEFMEHASTSALPGYLPTDGADLHEAMSAVDRQLRRDHRGRLGKTVLLGTSMGAFHTLYIAATSEGRPESWMRFDRFVALSTPVALFHGVSRLDEFFEAPRDWPLMERERNMENSLLKVASLQRSGFKPGSELPFDSTESRFLIGATFRYLLRDIIFSTQQRHDQGLVGMPAGTLRRDATYQRILGYSYRDYLELFVIPYYRNHGLPEVSAETLEGADDLRTYASGLSGNSRVRVLNNRNDFLMTSEDLSWLQGTIPSGQLTLFPQGGHMGNLSQPGIQDAILKTFEDLRSPSMKPQ